MKQTNRPLGITRCLTFLLWVVALCVGASLTGARASGVLEPLSNGGVSINGAHFLRDNYIWVPKGVTLLALVAPDTTIPNLALDEARKRFGSPELERVRAFGADVIRFQISEPGLDKESPIYSPYYKDRIGRAVALARRAGFAVILSMQWQAPSGLRDLPGMPGESAARAWREILPAVADDPGVMLELFNEPAVKLQAGFSEWVKTFQVLVDSLRIQGASNVLLIDGIGYARFLPADTPDLHDSKLQLGYAIHPYILTQYNAAHNWEAAFGKFAGSHPVLATEWNATSNLKFCQPEHPATARLLVRYLQEKRIGLVGWAFDYPDSIFKGDSAVPTNFDRFSCRRGAGNGAGELLQEAFAHSLH